MATKIRSRRVLATLAGAVTLFVWGAFSHMVLIKGIGFTALPEEETVVPALAHAMDDDGLYFFPGIDLRGTVTAEEQAAFDAKYRAGPTGLVIFHPGGEPPVSVTKLGKQLACDVLAAAIAVIITSLLAASYWRRVAAIAGIATIGWLGIGSVYWIWYGFPDAFFVAQGVDKIGGWLLAGLVIARFTDRAPASIVFV